jgi:protein-S-isoprenylcysteine O-methyltransferase Ste14
VVLLIAFRFVIQREERYLADAFGSEYAEWCTLVRRWL